MYDAYSEIRFKETAVEMDNDVKVLWSEESNGARFALLSSLTHSVKRDIIDLYSSQTEVSILQHPEWDETVLINGKVRYLTFYMNGNLRAYAIIRFPNPRIANVEFGPVAGSAADALEAIRRLVECVKQATSAWYLSVQLPWQSGTDTELVENTLREEFRVRTFSDKRNWSSSVIDTAKPDEEIRSAFSKNHRRSLKKAQKLGLTARAFDSDDDISAFNDIYSRMYETRGETIDRDQNLADYMSLREFFHRTAQGFFFGVFREDQLIGGMIIIKQGDYGFYHHSASDPEHRKIPVQHMGVVSVLAELRERGIRYFDFGGYNHMVDETDQVYNINRFKDGFTREYIYYPKIMYFEFVPKAVDMMDRFEKCKQLVKKVLRR